MKKKIAHFLILSLIITLPILSNASINILNQPDIKLGNTNSFVKQLQTLLNANGFIINNKSGQPGSQGFETTYFGEKTKQAIINFQNKYNIKPANGYVGIKTKTKIQALLKDKSWSEISKGKPVIDTVTSENFGLDAKVIAKWDVVPYQTFDSSMNVGVVAFHVNDIDRVDFFVNGKFISTEREMRMNSETNVVEYYVTLSAQNYIDGQIQVTATVYPKVGPALTIEPLILYSNYNKTLLNEIRYITINGSDTNDCLTESTACKTLVQALKSAHKSQKVDGAEIRFGEGYWKLEGIPYGIFGGFGPSFFADSRWLTLTSIPGVDKSKVKISGPDNSGLGIQLVKIKNVSVVGNVYPSLGASSASIWFDKNNMYYEDPNIIQKGTCGGGFHGYGSNWKDIFYTDVYIDNVCDGPKESKIIRNVFVDRSGGGHSSRSSLVINYSVKTVYGSGYSFPSGIGPDYHGDIYQFLGSEGDVILYGIRNIPGGFISSRGIAGAARNVAIVDVNLDFGGWVFSSKGPLDNIIFKNSNFVGAATWWNEEGGSPVTSYDTGLKNVLIENTKFINGTTDNLIHPVDIPGVKYKFTIPTAYTLKTLSLNGSIIKTPDQTSYTSGTPVTLTAIANGGYTFSGWKGCTSSTNTCFVTMYGDKIVSANFTSNSESNWSINYVDSQDTSGYSASQIFDNDISTMWHTEWKNSTPNYPHEIQINLGKTQTLSGFSYLPRQDVYTNGDIADYEFYTSLDGVNWGSPVSKGKFTSDKDVKIISFPNVNAQFIRLKALSSINGNPYAAAAEIGVSVSDLTIATTTPPTTTPTTYTLTASKTGTGTGSIIGISQSVTTLNQGDSITLTAQANTGSKFTGWGGDCSGTSSCVISNIQSNKVISANFDLIPTTITPTTYVFNVNLKFGMTHPDVKLLQKFLNNRGYTVAKSGSGSLGNETEYFGKSTQKALIKYQTIKAISPASGYFGPATREVVNNELLNSSI